MWETRPAAIPDTRGNQGWTFADAALLSLAFAWKDTWTDRLPRTGSRGGRYYQDLANAVRALGADVIEVQPLRTSKVDRYAHKVNEHAVVRPYRAVLQLNGVAGDRVVQAIGQSRHLGGGLLVPRDVPAAGLAAQHQVGDPDGALWLRGVLCRAQRRLPAVQVAGAAAGLAAGERPVARADRRADRRGQDVGDRHPRVRRGADRRWLRAAAAAPPGHGGGPAGPGR